MDGNIKYVHHSEVASLQARIEELEAINAKLIDEANSRMAENLHLEDNVKELEARVYLQHKLLKQVKRVLIDKDVSNVAPATDYQMCIQSVEQALN